MAKLRLFTLEGTFAVCRLEGGEPIPPWATGGNLWSVTSVRPSSTGTRELSVVCRTESVPRGVPNEPGWRCVGVEGPLDFSLTGVLASLTAPLAEAGISIFAISTYETDYLMVKEEDLQKALSCLSDAGHSIR